MCFHCPLKGGMSGCASPEAPKLRFCHALLTAVLTQTLFKGCAVNKNGQDE